MTELIDTLNELLPLSAPGGRTFIRLMRLREKTKRNVMLGPRDRKFVGNLVSRARDNVECIHLASNGGCKHPQKARCDCLDDFEKCPHYRAKRGSHRGNPLSGL